MTSAPSIYGLSNPSQTELDDFYQLYLSCFDDDPARKWSMGGFKDILSLEGVGAHLGSQDHVLIGFIIWRVTCDESEVLNIGVKVEERKKGIATDLLEGMLALMEKEKIKKIFLEVRASNLYAQKLYKGCGFEVTGSRKNYYSHQGGGREDAIVMTKLL